jgi:hypothetical protein
MQPAAAGAAVPVKNRLIQVGCLLSSSYACHHEQGERRLETLVEPVADRSEAGAEAHHGKNVRHEVNQRLGPQAPPSVPCQHQLRLPPLAA